LSITIVPDKASFTGFSLMSLDEPDKTGVPANVLEIELWLDNARLRKENENLRKIAEIAARSDALADTQPDALVEPAVLHVAEQ